MYRRLTTGLDDDDDDDDDDDLATSYSACIYPQITHDNDT